MRQIRFIGIIFSEQDMHESKSESRVSDLLRELVAVDSQNPPGHEAEVAKVLREHLESHGISCISVGASERPNLIFSTGDMLQGPLVLHGHMDTVPIGSIEEWHHDPLGQMDGERFYGRGACDMKGPLAALAETMILYSQEHHNMPLLMLATSDEESGCSGAEEVAKSGVLKGVKYGVCAEPTGMSVLIGEKGMLWTRIVCRGRSAHGSRPELGVNAIELCIAALEVLKSEYYYEFDELMGSPTINIGLIRGGLKINVVPDRCEAHLDMRLVRGQDIDSVLVEMKAKIEAADLAENVKIEYIHGKPAVRTPPDAEIVRVSLDAVESVFGRRPVLRSSTFGTDCSVLQPKVGIINVICGPGSIEQAHQPEEYISLRELFASVDVYYRIARHFCNSGH